MSLLNMQADAYMLKFKACSNPIVKKCYERIHNSIYFKNPSQLNINNLSGILFSHILASDTISVAVLQCLSFFKKFVKRHCLYLLFAFNKIKETIFVSIFYIKCSLHRMCTLKFTI